MPDARGFRGALLAGETAKPSELAGYKMTAFSKTEEKVIEDQILHGSCYFAVADALETAGGTSAGHEV
jgi:hypothetical protein